MKNFVIYTSGRIDLPDEYTIDYIDDMTVIRNDDFCLFLPSDSIISFA